MTDIKTPTEDKFSHLDGKIITDVIQGKRKEQPHDQWDQSWKQMGAGLDEQVFNRLPFGSDEQRDKMYYTLITDHLKSSKKQKQEDDKVKLKRVYKKEKSSKSSSQTGVKELTKTQSE